MRKRIDYPPGSPYDIPFTAIHDLSEEDQRRALEVIGHIEYSSDLGLDLVGYAHVWVQREEAGVHIYLFEVMPTGSRAEVPTQAEVEKALVYQDDSQPWTCTSVFLRQVWLFIPYYA